MSGVTETPRWPRRGYAWYVVILLMVLYLCSFLDRNIITLLVEPLKRDLDLSDVEIGMLYGLAFAAFYTTLGLFAAGIADLWNRPAVIAVGVVLWSLATAACGLASNYAQLFVARMLVGVGQAALSPAAYSLIADYFPPKARLRATATYAAGLYLGIGLATLTGGLVINWVAGGGSAELPVLGSLKGWQVVFIVVGLPGVLLGVLTLASVRETARFGEAPEAGVSARSFVRFLGGPQRTLYLTHFLGFSCQVTYSYSFGAWTPSFLIREFGWTQAQTGLGLGSVTLVTAPLGVYLGSVAAQRLRRRWPRDAEIRVAFAIALIALPFAVAFPFASTATLALALIGVTQCLISMPFGISPVALNEVTPNRFRARIIAVYLFCVNLLGLSLGPVGVALLTERVFGSPDRLPLALATMAVCTMPLAAAIFRVCAPAYRQVARNRA
ncbi:MAG: MFS transporter [Gammaproteobacteria bacterium]|nr:MFS transporter [Gammaproteobacteria bacterium]MDE0414933.1 MFS transporter [Gammaproteobacteria bacterium]